jgi:hypothetical protein
MSYRCLEPLSSLYSSIEGAPVGRGGRPQEEEEEDDDDEEEMLESLSLDLKERQEGEVEKPKKRVLLQQPPPTIALVYTLFIYLSQAFVSALTVEKKTINRIFHDRCKPLLKEIVAQGDHIERIMSTFVRRMILEIIARDDRGVKFKQILRELEELYLIEKRGDNEIPLYRGRNDFSNLDKIHLLAGEITRDSLLFYTEPEKDEFHKKCAATKKRGRRPTSESAVVPNRLNTIKSAYILSKKKLPPITYDERDGLYYLGYPEDYPDKVVQEKEDEIPIVGMNGQHPVDCYPIFVKTLQVWNDCIPRANNHGWYLEKLYRAVRCLSSKQWPMRGLVRSLLNAECIFERRKIRIERLPVGDNPYYCAYSGKPIEVGEEVWHIRILLHSGRRHMEWYRKDYKPTIPNTSSLYTGSIKCYLIKSRIVSQNSIFYSDFDPAYKALFAREFNPPKASLPDPFIKKQEPQPQTQLQLPANRAFSLNTLWILMNKLRVFIRSSQLDGHIWQKSPPDASCFALQRDNLIGLMLEVNVENFKPQIQSILFMGSFGEGMLRKVNQIGQSGGSLDPNYGHYLSLLYQGVLDFIDLMFIFQARPQEANLDPIVNKRFSLPLMGVEIKETDKIPMEQKRFKPRLNDPSSPFVTLLLEASSERDALRGGQPLSFSQQKEITTQLEIMILRHPILFLTLFNFIFQQQDLLQPPSFPECSALLSRMGLAIRTL